MEPTALLPKRRQVGHTETWLEEQFGTLVNQSFLHRIHPTSCAARRAGGPELKGFYQTLFSGAEIDFEALYVWHLESRRHK